MMYTAFVLLFVFARFVYVTLVIYICTCTMLLHQFDCIFFCNFLFFLRGGGGVPLRNDYQAFSNVFFFMY